jgi:hypothetical protein
MAFEHRRMGRQKVLYNSTNATNKLVYQLVIDGAKVTPTSATIAIDDPSGTEVLAATAMDAVSGTLMKYSVVTTTVADFPIGEGYRADIVVTYSGATYNRTLVFDVVRYLFDVNIGFDQLVALDGELRGRHNDGDEDLSNLIDAVRDEVQSDLETKILEGDLLLENMILDNSRISLAMRRRVLAQVYENADNEEKRDMHLAWYWRMLTSAIGAQRFDKNQDGSEDGTIGGVHPIRLVM